jgi:hypothetical protein
MRPTAKDTEARTRAMERSYGLLATAQPPSWQCASGAPFVPGCSHRNSDHPIQGDDTCSAVIHPDGQVNPPIVRHNPVARLTYEITLRGQAGRTLRAQFDECKVTTSPDTTTLRAELSDQAALSGLVQRIVGLGLVVIDVHLVALGSS